MLTCRQYRRRYLRFGADHPGNRESVIYWLCCFMANNGTLATPEQKQIAARRFGHHTASAGLKRALRSYHRHA